MPEVYRRPKKPAMILSNSAKKIGWLTDKKPVKHARPVC